MAERRIARSHRQQMAGLTLVELLVSIAISLFMVGVLIVLYVNSSAARTELDRSSRQIENGRYAIDMLREDIALAGYYGELFPREIGSYIETNPCATTVATMGWTATSPTVAPAPLQGPGVSTTLGFAGGCAAANLNQRANTGYLIVRRVRPEALAPAAAVNTAFYLQSNRCIEPPAGRDEAFLFNTGPSGNFDLYGADCTSDAAIRRYESKLYYVADCGVCAPSDGVPTLKVQELVDNAIVERIVADGIEDLQFEFGLDADGDGVADSYVTSGTAADWPNVVAVRIHLISRGASASPGYSDDKTYDRGAFAPYTPAAGDVGFKRRSYSTVVHLPNIAGPRETP